MTSAHTTSTTTDGLPHARRLPSWRTVSSSLDELVDRRGDVRAISIMRMLFGVIVIRHFWPDLTADVTPVEHFHVPWWSWLPVPSAGLYRTLVAVGCLGGVAMLVRPIARAGTIAAFCVVTYLLFVDMTTFSHNRGFLAWLLLGMSLIPAGPVSAGRLLWPLMLLRGVASLIYLASGGSKLLDPDWRGGLVLWDRVMRYEHLIPFDGWLYDLITSRLVHRFFSPAAIATELFIGIGLWFRRTRLAAIWVAILFHVLIEVTAHVQTFSYSGIAATLLWVTPSTRDRVLVTPSGALRTLVARLDWLHRFRIESPHTREVTDPAAATGGTHLVERDGTVRRDGDAWLTALCRLPVLFSFVAPVLAVRRAGSASAARRQIAREERRQ